jgi:hypothetical protein
MATKVEIMAITCPKCGEEYSTWQGVGPEPLEPDPCPRCGFIPTDDPQVYWDGVVEPLDEDEARLPG